MGDVLDHLLPFLTATPFGIIVVVLGRLWLGSVSDLRAERADHEQTQQAWDAERAARRRVEDEMARLTREVEGLRAEVAALRRLHESGS